MSLPEKTNPAQDQGRQQQAEGAQQGAQNATDNRQQAIEKEDDTARLRSERKSVEDGSGNESGDGKNA